MLARRMLLLLLLLLCKLCAGLTDNPSHLLLTQRL
jgi:hypothetical protein